MVTGSRTSFTEITWAQRSIFTSFLFLWIIYGLLNQLAQIRGIRFHAAAVVWFQEVLKLVLSIILFCLQDGGPVEFCRSVREHWTMACWYLIPAGLYALTDVLTYVNLRSFDPATYYLLSEMKLVLTAAVHQTLFGRKLNMWHWIALATVTTGCVVKTSDSLETRGKTDGDDADRHTNDNGDATPILPKPTLFNYFVLLVQILASTVAGVYNEKLLKDKPSIPINLQNICLYGDGILLLTLGFLFQIADAEHSTIAEALGPSNMRTSLHNPVVLAVATVMSVAGIVTSRFLSAFDSVRKSVAAALVVVVLPFLSRCVFDTEVTMKMVLSVALVVGGMYLYSSQPPPTAGTSVAQDEAFVTDVKEEDITDEDGDMELFLPALSPTPPDWKIGEYGEEFQEGVSDGGRECNPNDSLGRRRAEEVIGVISASAAT